MKPLHAPPSRPWPRILACAAALTALAGSVSAHDTWFQRLPGAAATLPLALGTGKQFPAQEFAVGPEHLARQGCADADGAVWPMTPHGGTATALHLQSPSASTGLSCWAQLQPMEIEMPADKVRLYLDEVQAPAAVRAAWAAMQARGLPWRERYTKHARIELPGNLSGRRSPLAARPSGMGMDMLMLGGPADIRVGAALVVQVQRDGQPLPGFAVQLRSELSPVGLWQQTDAQGRVHLRPPLPGRWLLRGTELTAPVTGAGRWEGRFVTLAFDVVPASK